MSDSGQPCDVRRAESVPTPASDGGSSRDRCDPVSVRQRAALHAALRGAVRAGDDTFLIQTPGSAGAWSQAMLEVEEDDASVVVMLAPADPDDQDCSLSEEQVQSLLNMKCARFWLKHTSREDPINQQRLAKRGPHYGVVWEGKRFPITTPPDRLIQDTVETLVSIHADVYGDDASQLELHSWHVGYADPLR